MKSISRRWGIAAMLTLLAGCCVTEPPEDVARYNWIDAPTALRDACRRSSEVKTLSSECALTLTRADGQSVQLDGAIATRLPDSARIRAWKFGQAVFDLTLTPDGLWIEAGSTPEQRGRTMPAGMNAARVARAFSTIWGDFFCAPDLRVVEDGDPNLVVERNVEGQHVICTIDRRTLTPREYRLLDADGHVRFRLVLDHYSTIAQHAWPLRLVAYSAGGVIRIELKDPELNADLAPAAFIPPAKAEKMPSGDRPER